MLSLLLAAHLAAAVPCVVAPSSVPAEGGIYCPDSRLDDLEKAAVPGLTLRTRGAGTASATQAPWVDSNGWRFLRKPAAKYLYELPKNKALLAAAEAFAFAVEARLKIAPEDLKPLEALLAFLKSVPVDPALKPAANINIIDTGSPAIPEAINLMVRRNLLCRVAPAADRSADLNVRIGSPEFPEAEAANPSAVADKARQLLTDRKRLLRVYGTEVVIGRVELAENRARIHLLNYSSNSIQGVRVRLRGAYPELNLRAYGFPGKAEEVTLLKDSTEFTVPEMGPYAVVDLKRSK